MTDPKSPFTKIDHQSLIKELKNHTDGADVGRIDEFSIAALLVLNGSRAREILTTRSGNIDELLVNARKDAGNLLTSGDSEDEKIQSLKEREDISQLLLGLQWSAAYGQFDEFDLSSELDRLSASNEDARAIFDSARDFLDELVVANVQIEGYISTPEELALLTKALETAEKLQQEEHDQMAGAEYEKT